MSYTPTEWESTDVVTATRMNALEQAVGDMNMSYTPNVWLDGDILSAEKMNALEQAVASGGGGSSDFSTAQVTVTNNGEAQTFYGAINVVGDYLSPDYVSDGSTPTIVTAVLYKGTTHWMIPTGTVNTTGNATTETAPFGTAVIITGDCTITIS